MERWRIFVSLLLFAPFGRFTCAIPLPSSLSTTSGNVHGVLLRNSVVFRSIPYAEPPLGPLRFRAPKAKVSSADLNSAQVPAPCATLRNEGESQEIIGSEDCLYLSIWAPQTNTQHAPVLVVLLGEDFFDSLYLPSPKAQTPAAFDGLLLSERANAIVVFVQYRLGVFGFLAHPALTKEAGHSGNYGLLDQILALKWIQKNIKNFGGDAHNVTLLGHGTGATSACALLSSPLAHGLFSKLILQSGSCDLNRSLRAEEALGADFVKEVGCENDMNCVREKDTATLLAYSHKLLNANNLLNPALTFMPVVDGYVLLDSTASALSHGEKQHVPILLGHTAGEISVFQLDSSLKTLSGSQFLSELVRQFGADVGTKLYALYAPTNFPTTQDAIASLLTDLQYTCKQRQAARLLTSQGNHSVYLYELTEPLGEGYQSLLPWIGDVNDGSEALPIQPWHGTDLIYTFQGVDAFYRGLSRSVDPLASDKLAENNVLEYWKAFIHKGNPNSNAMPLWPNYGANQEKFEEIDAAPSTRDLYYRAKCDAYDLLFPMR